MLATWHGDMAGAGSVHHLKSGGGNQIITRGHVDLNLRGHRSVRASLIAERSGDIASEAARLGRMQDNNPHLAESVSQNRLIEAAENYRAYPTGTPLSQFLGLGRNLTRDLFDSD